MCTYLNRMNFSRLTEKGRKLTLIEDEEISWGIIPWEQTGKLQLYKIIIPLY